MSSNSSQEDIHQLFERFDSNNDGKISIDEFQAVLKLLKFEISAEEVNRMMEDMDTNKDGHISLKEFVAFSQGGSHFNEKKSIREEKELRDAFEFYDQNHDGKISVAELHNNLTSLGQHCSVEDCSKMIASVDLDGDGQVSLEEFKKMMKNNKN